MIISDFCGFLDFFLDLDREIMDFYKYLDQDFSSQPYLFTFCASKLASKWAKSVGNSIFFFLVKIFKIETFQSRLGCVKIFLKIVETIRDYQDKSRQP